MDRPGERDCLARQNDRMQHNPTDIGAAGKDQIRRQEIER